MIRKRFYRTLSSTLRFKVLLVVRCMLVIHHHDAFCSNRTTTVVHSHPFCDGNFCAGMPILYESVGIANRLLRDHEIIIYRLHWSAFVNYS